MLRLLSTHASMTLHGGEAAHRAGLHLYFSVSLTLFARFAFPKEIFS
ncbi:hypothetical protein [Paraburkholderia fynbosensis]|nr:hypothetical protein [Paraburkholderia fynbosensis]